MPLTTTQRLQAALAHIQAGQRQRAQEELQAALAQDPHQPATLQLLGNLAYEAGALNEAQTWFRRVLDIAPQQADVWCSLATVQFQADDFASGFQSIDRALAIAPGQWRAHAVRGSALARLKRDAEALIDLAAAIQQNPGDTLSFIHYWACAERLCGWTQAQALWPQILRLVREGSPRVPPFALLGVSDDPALHLEAALNRARKYPSAATQVYRPPAANHPARYRVAYLSADFHDHATTHLMAGVFEHHDQTLFEVFAVSIGPPTGDAVRQRLEQVFAHFLDAQLWTDAAIADWLVAQQIDLLIDLKGHTEQSRPGIVALKPAPVVAAYLGYPGTCGLASVDYIIGDAVVTPFEDQRYFSERIVQLPHSYQCNDRARPLPRTALSRASEGLPEDARVFAAFNQPYKIRPDVFDAWCRILHRLPNSVLWLLCDHPQTQHLLRQQAALRGVAPERLVFANRQDRVAHLARHALADLFLDTAPCNAHTTASDALWMGLPVLTLKGRSFASRVAASLLQCSGLSNLVTHHLTDYENQAVALGQNPAALAAMKRQLESGRMANPLFDTAAFTRHLEAAFAHMINRWRSGLAAAPFAVQNDGSAVSPPGA